jgi:hypothetical protein
MATVKINPDVDVSGPKPVPSGRYELRCVEMKDPVKAKESDNMVVHSVFEVVNHADETLNGRQIFPNFSLTEKSYYRLKQCAIACGVETEESLQASGGSIDLSAFPGTVCEASVGTKSSDYEGVTREQNTIRNFLIQGQE